MMAKRVAFKKTRERLSTRSKIGSQRPAEVLRQDAGTDKPAPLSAVHLRIARYARQSQSDRPDKENREQTPDRISGPDMLTLQRTLGNRAFGRMLTGGRKDAVQRQDDGVELESGPLEDETPATNAQPAAAAAPVEDKEQETGTEEITGGADETIQATFLDGLQGTLRFEVAGAGESFAESSGQSGLIQRQPQPEADKVYIGTFYFFDWNDKILLKALAYKGATPPSIGPGYYKISLSGSGSKWSFTADGNRLSYTIDKNAGPFNRAVKTAKSVFLAIHTVESGPPASATRETGAYKPGKESDDPAGGSGGQGGQGNQEGRKDAPGSGTGSGNGPSETGGKEGRSSSGPSDEERKRGPSGRPDGSGKGAETGSKYGWLGLFNLPPAVIAVLEGIIDALGKSDEILAMRDTLQSFADLAKHRQQMAELFDKPETLLEIVLGLKENAAVDALSGWAVQDVKPPRPAKSSARAGIVKLAFKLVALLRKVRMVLKPVFQLRTKFQEIHAQVGAVMAMLPVLEQLLDLAEKAAQGKTDDLKLAAESAATEFAESLQEKMDPLKNALKAPGVFFSKDDFVSYEQVAQAVVSAVSKAVPAAYKPVVYIAMELGLDKQIANNIVAPMIPKEALDAINSTIKDLGAKFTPTIKEGSEYLVKIIDEIDEQIGSDLPPLISSALVMKSAKHPGQNNRSADGTGTRIKGRSSAEPLEPGIREEMGSRLGFDVDGVSIHKDPPAHNIADQLNAHAFAFGDHIYFGKDEYAPHTHAGKQLLAHELTHVEQMRRPGEPVGVHATYKDLLTRLSGKYSKSVIEELKGARITSQTKRDKATEIKDKVDKLIGRLVVSKNNPKLPEGYTYVEKKGRIVSIRRHFSWIRYIPALTIDKNGRIKLSALLSAFDPKAAARKKLRRSLPGIRSNQEAHHVIPLELQHHPLMKLATSNGWEFNGTSNGVALSSTLVHTGSHPVYTQKMLQKLNALQSKYGTDWAKIQGPLQQMIDKEKTELKSRRSKLR